MFRTNSVHYIRQSPSRSTGDSTVRVSLPSRLSRPALSHTRIKQVWCTKSLTPLYVINPFLDTDSGDLFSLVWSPAHSTIYIGCQNTSIQWYNLSDVAYGGSQGLPSGASTPRRAHKFFNSYPRSQRRDPDLEATPSSIFRHRMSSTRPTTVMYTAWYSYLPPAKARRTRRAMTFFSLPGAAMRLSRFVA